ncbi:hypothetical protein [Neptunicella sp. SCSIO 80796]|uniref:hypothetical protein n=1 Tax=Neptunicella plasticusilytica TaxID=3117012 RepID=UPI003A4DBB74
MRLTYLLLSIFLLCMPCHAGQLYKVVQEDGTVIYTDMPAANAIPVDLSSANSAVMPAFDAKLPAKQKKTSNNKPAVQYALEISQPADQQTIRNNSGDMSVIAKITPNTSGLAQLFLDGKMIMQQASLNFDLHNINRGEHVIKIKLVSQTGKLIASSQDRVFYLHRASVLNRSN